MPEVEDRSFLVEPGKTVKSEWIDIDTCVLGNRERMDFAAIERTGRKLLQQGDCGSWPPPNGYWSAGKFVICDGRHEYMAALALGRTRLFVAWLIPNMASV